MKKTFNIWILLCVMLLMVQNVRVQAAENDISSQLGLYYENVVWDDDYSVRLDNALVLDGIVYQYQRETDSFTAASVDVRQWERAGNLTIAAYVAGKPVTEISPRMFNEDYGIGKGVTGITFPDTIQKSIYMESIKIKNLILPSDLKDPGFFSECSFEKVVLPKNAVKSGIFKRCTSLRNIVLPDGLKIIESFSGCTSLANVQLPETVTEIQKAAFLGCKNLELYVPASMKTIGKNAFGTGKNNRIKMLYCVRDSAAHKYAKKNSIPYTLISKKVSDRKLTGLTAVKKSVTLVKGESCYAEVRVRPFHAVDQEFTYKSSNSKAVSVDENGKIIAKKYGSKAVITITAKSNRKFKAKMTVKVEKHIFKLNRNKKSVTFYLDCAKDGVIRYEVWQSDTKDIVKAKRVAVVSNSKSTVKYPGKTWYCIRPRIRWKNSYRYGSFSKWKRL